jgi:hypothetical protein
MATLVVELCAPGRDPLARGWCGSGGERVRGVPSVYTGAGSGAERAGAVAGLPHCGAGDAVRPCRGSAGVCGLCAIGIQERHRLRQRGWLFMVLVLAALALPVELWLLVGYDIPLLRAIAWGEPTVEALDALLLRRAQAAGAAASLATLAEWTIALLCVWRPLERAEHVRNALEGVGAGAA